MFIYFLEQVWNYEGDKGWSKLGWETRETQRCFWDHWHLHIYPDGTPAYETMTVPPMDHMEEGNDWLDW